MNDKQKFFAIAAGAVVIGVILGFLVKGTNSTPAPAPAPQAAQQTPAPGTESAMQKGPEAPVAPAKAVDLDKVVTTVNGYIDTTFPGEWKASAGKLSKGTYVENDNYKIVDGVETVIPGSMISVFVSETQRIATNIKQQGAGRALDYPIPTQVGETFKSSKVVKGGGGSMGSSSYAKVFIPLTDKAGKAVGVMSISVPQ
jgi:hypothetical protein